MSHLSASPTYQQMSWCDCTLQIRAQPQPPTIQQIWAVDLNDNGMWMPLETALLLVAKGAATLIVQVDE